MFNQGIRRVQDMLLENGNKEAVFDVSKVTAMVRNRYVCEMADRILFVGVTEQSSLYPYKNEYRNKLEKNI